MTAGEYFERFLTEGGIRVKDLAKRSGVAENTIRYWMRGKFSPSADKWVAVVDALNALPCEREAHYEDIFYVLMGLERRNPGVFSAVILSDGEGDRIGFIPLYGGLN